MEIMAVNMENTRKNIENFNWHTLMTVLIRDCRDILSNFLDTSNNNELIFLYDNLESIVKKRVDRKTITWDTKTDQREELELISITSRTFDIKSHYSEAGLDDPNVHFLSKIVNKNYVNDTNDENTE